jgi:hypothetical protein
MDIESLAGDCTFAKLLADKWIAETAAIKTRQPESDE